MDIYPTIPHKWHLKKNTCAREGFGTKQLSSLGHELIV